MAAGQFLLHGLKGDALVDHEHGQVVQQVGQLAHGVLLLAVFGGDDDLAALLAALFQNLVQALLKEVAGVRALLLLLAAALYGFIQLVQNIHGLLPFR